MAALCGLKKKKKTSPTIETCTVESSTSTKPDEKSESSTCAPTVPTLLAPDEQLLKKERRLSGPVKPSALRRLSQALGIYKQDKVLAIAEDSDEILFESKPKPCECDCEQHKTGAGQTVEPSTPSDINIVPPQKKRFSFSAGVEQKGRKVLVASHRQLSMDLDDLTTTTTQYQRILQELNDTYRQSEGDCPCFRYGDMRAMVERALSSYEGVTKQAEATEEDDLVGPGALARLKDNSRKFSVLEQSRRQQEERYDVMSEKELHEGVAVLQKEHDRLKDMNDDVSVKLQRLSSQYNDMRSYCCLRRYARIKAMIQEATRDCLREM